MTIRTVIKEEQDNRAESENTAKSVVVQDRVKINQSKISYKAERQGISSQKSIIKTPVKTPEKKISSIELMQKARTLMVSDQNAAISLLEKNKENLQPDTDYYALLANLYQRQKRFDDAIVSYYQALSIAPDKGELWIGIGLAFLGTGEKSKALSEFQRASSSVNISSALKQYADQQIRKIVDESRKVH